MPVFAVQYTYDPATAASRDRIRPDHRGWLAALVEAGTVLSTGPFADGSGALIIVSAASSDAARALFRDDPFQHAGLVAAARFTEWTPVLGAFTNP